LSDEPAITALYVPGDRPDRFDKAYRSGADLVILDLEDAVAPDAKALARTSVVRWITGLAESGPRLQVRVNRGSADDFRAIADLPASIEVRLPTVESAAEVDAVASAVGERPVSALLESAEGIERAFQIADHPAVSTLGIGESDLASQFGSGDPTLMEQLRVRVVVAALAAGLPAPMMSAFPGIGDVDGLRADTGRGRKLGFVGRSAIHPSQLPVIRAAFRPSSDDLAWAKEILAAVGAGGVARLASGEMADAAMVGRASHILRLVAATVERA
jgi:citrate lyase subunit beta/citryl-CoA lyase